MRQPKPWFQKFNDMWYVQTGRRQVPLAKRWDCEAEAYRRCHALMLQQDIADVHDEREINVTSVCGAILPQAQ